MSNKNFDFASIDAAREASVANQENDKRIEEILRYGKSLDELVKSMNHLRESGEIDSIREMIDKIRMLPTYIELMHNAAQIKVYPKCREEYNTMCAEARDKFVSEVRSGLSDISRDYKADIRQFTAERLNSLKKHKESVSIPRHIFWIFVINFIALMCSYACIFYTNATHWHSLALWKTLIWPMGISLVLTTIILTIRHILDREPRMWWEKL